MPYQNLQKESVDMELFKFLTFSKELQKRIISGVILAPIILAIVYLGGIVYQVLILTMSVIMSFEWSGITSHGKNMTSKSKRNWSIIGTFYIVIFAASLLFLRESKDGFNAVLFLLLVVWATDIGAFFAGRIIGGPKIAPKISPKKTWAGLAGGMAAAAVTGVFLSAFSTVGLLELAILSAVLAVISQVGDFYESWIKRKFGVKDSGNIIPGHGGIMDRVDGLTTVAPILAIFYVFKDAGIF